MSRAQSHDALVHLLRIHQDLVLQQSRQGHLERTVGGCVRGRLKGRWLTEAAEDTEEKKGGHERWLSDAYGPWPSGWSCWAERGMPRPGLSSPAVRGAEKAMDGGRRPANQGGICLINLRIQIQIGKLYKAEPNLTIDLIQLMAAANDFITIIEAHDLIQRRDVQPQDAFFEAHGLYFFRLCLGHLDEIMRTLKKLGTEYPHILAKAPPELHMLYDRIITITAPFEKMISRLRNKSVFHYDQPEIDG